MKRIHTISLAVAASLAAGPLQAQALGTFRGSVAGDVSANLSGTALACLSDMGADMRNTMLVLEGGAGGNLSVMIPGAAPQPGTQPLGSTMRGEPFATYEQAGARGDDFFAGDGTLTITAADRQHVQGTLQMAANRSNPPRERARITVTFNAQRAAMVDGQCVRQQGGAAAPQSAAEALAGERLAPGSFAMVIAGNESVIARGTAGFCPYDERGVRVVGLHMNFGGGDGQVLLLKVWPTTGQFGVGPYDNMVSGSLTAEGSMYLGREGVVTVTAADASGIRGDFEMIVYQSGGDRGEYTLTGTFHAAPGPRCQTR